MGERAFIVALARLEECVPVEGGIGEGGPEPVVGKGGQAILLVAEVGLAEIILRIIGHITCGILGDDQLEHLLGLDVILVFESCHALAETLFGGGLCE